MKISSLLKLAGTTVLLFAAQAAIAAETLAVAQRFPAARALGVSPDTPLRLTFNSAPTLSGTGRIRICDGITQEVIETIDLSAKTGTQDIGGMPGFKYYPVIITGNEVAIYPKRGTMNYDNAYFILIDAGVFQSGDAVSAAVVQTSTWRFATKAAPPAAGSARVTVAADGSGDFCTVQGALDWIPARNTNPVTLFIRKGTYHEIIALVEKNAITLLGEDRKQTIIAYANNAQFNPDLGGNPFGGAAPVPVAVEAAKGPIYRRGMILAHNTQDFTIANLTLRNTTPFGGSQSETIIFNGTTTARAILKDVDFYSFQDTIQVNGQAFFSNCYIEGDVDFMWGTGPCFFENCTARSVNSDRYYTQIRNQPTNHGYVYYRCTFDGSAGVTGNFLSRIGAAKYGSSEVVLIDCVMTKAVSDVAWQMQGAGDNSKIHFWEFNSHAPDGTPVDVSKRLAVSKQLKKPEDAATIADYSNPTFVLGSGWDPKKAAIFQPAAK